MAGRPASAAKSQPLPAQGYGLWPAACGVEGPRKPSLSWEGERALAPSESAAEARCQRAAPPASLTPGEVLAEIPLHWAVVPYPHRTALTALYTLLPILRPTSVTMWFGSSPFNSPAAQRAQRGMAAAQRSPTQRGSLARDQARMVGSSLGQQEGAAWLRRNT
jgi:hypothetical protein